MKKLFSYVLALTLLVSTMSVAFAAPEDVKEKSEVQAVDVLMALGVVNGYEDGTYKPEKEVTRAEMAKLIVTALGFEDLAKGSTNDFTDAKDHWAKGYIGVCVSLGIVEGRGEGKFAPDSTVKYSEAATMLVRALGWTNDAIGGVWPVNYVSKAMSLDMFKGVQYVDDGATRGDIAELLFNTLELGIGTIDQNGRYSVKYETDDDAADDTKRPLDNMLKRLGAQVGESDVIIGNEATTINLFPYIGQQSKTYLDRDGKIILVMNAATTLTGKMSADGKEFVVSENEKYTVKTSDAFKYFLNTNKEDDSANSDDAAIAKSTLTLSAAVSGKQIKNIYSASKWIVTKHGMMDDRDLAKLENKKELFGQKFPLNDENEIDVDQFILYGVEKVEDIKKDDAVFVYTSGNVDGDVITKVAVSDDVVENVEITSRKSDNSEITADGKTYTRSVLSTALNFSYDKYKPGTKVNLMLDAYGKVYDAKVVEAQKLYGVVLNTANASTQGLSSAYAEIKLFLADGTTKIFKVSHKADGTADLLIDADGQWKTGMLQFPADPATYDKDNHSPGKAVEYSVNEDGMITGLKLLTYDAQNDVNVSKSGIVDGQVLVESSFALNAVVPYGTAYSAVVGDPDVKELTKKSNYAVIAVKDVKGAKNISGQLAADTSKNKVQVFMIESDESIEKIYGVVGGYTQMSNTNKVTVFTDGEEKVYNVADEPTAFSNKLVLVKVNRAGNGYEIIAAPVADYNLVLFDDNPDSITDPAGVTTESNLDDAQQDAEILNGNILRIRKAAGADYSAFTLSDKLTVVCKKGTEAVKAAEVEDLVDDLKEDTRTVKQFALIDIDKDGTYDVITIWK